MLKSSAALWPQCMSGEALFMSQFRTLSTIVFSLLGVGLGFLMFGWWAVLIVVAGISWQLAVHRTTPTQAAPIRHQPAASQSQPVQSVTEAPPRVVAKVSTPNRDPRPWQERVEEIERNRPSDVAQPQVEGARHDHTQSTSACTKSITQIAQIAHIDPAPLLAQRAAIKAAIDSGDAAKLNKLIRTLCPSQVWVWPEAQQLLEDQGKRGTRLQMVELVASMLMRQASWAKRLPQMLASIDSRPYWQFRAVGDSRDPSECKALCGRVERYDSSFWLSQAPWQCARAECRCTVRTLTPAELAAKGLPIPD